jgi:hypothetical protein
MHHVPDNQLFHQLCPQTTPVQVEFWAHMPALPYSPHAMLRSHPSLPHSQSPIGSHHSIPQDPPQADTPRGHPLQVPLGEQGHYAAPAFGQYPGYPYPPFAGAPYYDPNFGGYAPPNPVQYVAPRVRTADAIALNFTLWSS